jgi:EpsI family protein
MSQREGDTMHSPMNCLPGSGWQPVQSGHITVLTEGGPREINRYIVEKSGEELLVLYWYQSHGRVVASEYWGKIYMVLDAVRLNRTDAALVRVVVPISHLDPAGEKTAETLGTGFVRAMFPLLDRHVPS